MEAGHTPVPFSIAHGSSRMIIAEDRIEVVAETYGELAEENATFIVTACNEHEALKRKADKLIQALHALKDMHSVSGMRAMAELALIEAEMPA